MRDEFTAIIERDGNVYRASPELPESNGQGRTPEEAKKALSLRFSSSSMIVGRMYGDYGVARKPWYVPLTSTERPTIF